MRQFSLAGLLVLAPLTLSGCDDVVDCCSFDDAPPSAPRGLLTYTGDRQVELSWIRNGEPDVAGYRVWRGRSGRERYECLATIYRDRAEYLDRGLENGVTYFYALSAFDDSDNESNLSADDVHDTPRPEGFDLRLCNSRTCPREAGFDFSSRSTVGATALEADVYFWASEEEGPWMIATERSPEVYTDVQDAGYRELDRVDVAPLDGWAPNGEVPLVPGHCYVVWTWDDHYAKFWIVEVDGERVLLDWAYQPDRANPELSAPPRSQDPVSGGKVHKGWVRLPHEHGPGVRTRG